MRFDHLIDFCDDVSQVRQAYLVGEDPDRVHVIVTRGIRATHVVSRSAERLVGCCRASCSRHPGRNTGDPL